MQRDKENKQKMAEAARKAEAEAAAQGDTTALFHAALNGANEDIVLKNQKVQTLLRFRPIKKAMKITSKRIRIKVTIIINLRFI